MSQKTRRIGLGSLAVIAVVGFLMFNAGPAMAVSGFTADDVTVHGDEGESKVVVQPTLDVTWNDLNPEHVRVTVYADGTQAGVYQEQVTESSPIQVQTHEFPLFGGITAPNLTAGPHEVTVQVELLDDEYSTLISRNASASFEISVDGTVTTVEPPTTGTATETTELPETTTGGTTHAHETSTETTTETTQSSSGGNTGGDNTNDQSSMAVSGSANTAAA